MKPIYLHNKKGIITPKIVENNWYELINVS